MATSVHEPPKIEDRKPTGFGNGGGGRIAPPDAPLPAVKDYAPPPSSTAIWVLLFSITMSFLALTSAVIIRQANPVHWQHLTLPRILFFNTAVLLFSSLALELGRRDVGAFMRPLAKPIAHPGRWLYVSLAFGVLFLVGQYIAWLQLRSEGLYLATNANSSFFYVLTAMHAFHLLGGLGGLARVVVKLNHSTLRKSTLDATARYWHFMDVLWIYLLWLLWTRIQ
jgi:cytochrome c oxidase subunit III